MQQKDKPTMSVDNEINPINVDYERILDSNRYFLVELIEQYHLKEARKLLTKFEADDVAQILSGMKESQRIIAFRILPQEEAVEIFSHLEPREQEEFLANFSLTEVRDIIENMDPDDRTELFEDLPAMMVRKLLRLLSPEERKIANQLLNYSEDTAGRIMTPEYVDFEENITVKQAMKIIREEAPDKETIYTCYVVNKQGKLTGVVSLRKIILADSKQKISSIMSTEPIMVSTFDDQQKVAKAIKDYDFIAIPVVDNLTRLVGIVTFDDVMDIMQEENTEDFQLIAGIAPTDDGYLKSNFFRLLFNRSIWIVALLFIASFTQDIIVGYKNNLEPDFYASLSVFFTILIGVAGNIGSQSSILVIRGLATGEITRKDTWRLLGRSLLMGLSMGAILAGFMLLRILIFKTGSEIKWVVSAALAGIVFTANFLGALLPVGIKKLGIDPALISSPLITTIIDIGGLVLYFEIARLILRFA